MWQQVEANNRKTVILVVSLCVVLVLAGYFLAELIAPGMGLYGIAGAWFIWLFQAIISYYSGDKIFLMLSHARRIESQDHPVLFNVVEEMKLASGLEYMPKVYIIDDDAPNAFATGRDPEHAA